MPRNVIGSCQACFADPVDVAVVGRWVRQSDDGRLGFQLDKASNGLRQPPRWPRSIPGPHGSELAGDVPALSTPSHNLDDRDDSHGVASRERAQPSEPWREVAVPVDQDVGNLSIPNMIGRAVKPTRSSSKYAPWAGSFRDFWATAAIVWAEGGRYAIADIARSFLKLRTFYQKY
jgi:hypothetical protein